MEGVLFWLYLVNALVLIVHEIDSAYWQEWDLFHLAGGETGFLLLHLPLLLPVLYGLVLVDRDAFAGLILSGFSLSRSTPSSSAGGIRNSRRPNPRGSFGLQCCSLWPN